jgi:hypothetical protein
MFGAAKIRRLEDVRDPEEQLAVVGLRDDL